MAAAGPGPEAVLTVRADVARAENLLGARDQALARFGTCTVALTG